MPKLLADYRRNHLAAPFKVVARSKEWAEYVRFINAWFEQTISPASGFTAEELKPPETQAHRPLPGVLHEWFTLMGNHESLRDETAQDYEVFLKTVWSSERYYEIYGENQDCWCCGILNEHQADPDPPIYFDSGSFDPVKDAGHDPASLVDGHYIRFCDSLPQFMLGVAIRQIALRVEASPFVKDGVWGADFEDALEIIQPICPLKRVFDFPAGFSPWLGEDVIVAQNWGFATRTPEKFEQMEEAINAAGRKCRGWGG